MNIVDAHLDLAYNAVERLRDITAPASAHRAIGDEIATCGLPDLLAGNVTKIFATVFCFPSAGDELGYRTPAEAHANAIAQLEYYAQLAAGGLLRIAPDASPTPPGQIDAVILLEGAEAIRTIDDVGDFVARGVRIVGLAWQATRYAGGTGTPGGLTREGRRLVRELDDSHVLHDASHLAEHSFWDLINATSRTIIASHSNCRHIVQSDPRERHLTDAMIRAIAARDGVIGINFFDRFLLPDREYGRRRASLDDVVLHMKHIIHLTGSARHVAIGTDLDGGLGRDQIPVEITTAADMPRVGETLRDANFSDDDIALILHGNWERILETLR